jgi:hypothetical protein
VRSSDKLLARKSVIRGLSLAGNPIARYAETLSLGSQTIGLAEFRMQLHGGLVLVDYRLRQIPADPTNEEARHVQITAALRELMEFSNLP